ncbi:MAG: TerB family tellurite resistance protein, partial [Primorskyibacter sp.]
LLRRLGAPDPAPLPDPDARLALVALLVRVARADGHMDDAEATRIDRIARARFGLSPFEATALRRDAETLEAEAPDTVKFTNAIKEAVPYDDRLGVIEALWQVALADGARDDAEDQLLRLVARFLGINDRDSAFARQRVAKHTQGHPNKDGHSGAPH